MSHLYELHRFVLYEIPWLENKIVLDAGCGHGIWGYLLRAEKRGDRAYIVGLDVYKPYLRFVQKYAVYDDLVLADVRNLPFQNHSFDVTLACELLEHLPKHSETVFFEESERVTSEKIVLTTPNGPWDLEGSTKIKSEAHESGYEVSNFKVRGYRVHGFGFRFIKLYKAQKFSVQKIWAGIGYLFTPISYIIPFFAEFLIASKNLGKTSSYQRDAEHNSRGKTSA